MPAIMWMVQPMINIISFQHPWSDKEQNTTHNNLLELRVAILCLCELSTPGNVIRLYLDNMTAFVGETGGTHSLGLRTEKLKLWWEAIKRNITKIPKIGYNHKPTW